MKGRPKARKKVKSAQRDARRISQARAAVFMARSPSIADQYMSAARRGKSMSRPGRPGPMAVRVGQGRGRLPQAIGGKIGTRDHKKWKGSRLMPWGKGTVVTGAKGFVFLAGNTATIDDYDPFKKGGGAAGDAAAQWRNILVNIKSDLEELGSSLDHLIRLTFFVKGPFPNGSVLSSPNFRQDVLDDFFAQHCSKHCSYNNPPPSEVIGVAALAHPDLVIEIVAVAAVPD